MLPLFGDDGGYKITNYIFEGSLSKDNVLTVNETIYVDFFENRHGIYRSIPEHFRLDRMVGNRYATLDYYPKIHSIDTGYDNSTSSYEDGVRSIKIGDADKLISGQHVYNISYVVEIPDDRVKNGDFFYYSVLGPFWDVPIDEFSYRVNFEKPIPVNTEFNVFSGDKYSETNSMNVENNVSTTAIWGTANNISSHSAITLYADLPEGFFENPASRNSLPTWIFAILSVVTAIYALIKAMTTIKKEPVETVEFYPPKDIYPVDIGYIIDSSADDADFIAMIPHWAQKGYLKIEENDGKFKKSGIKLTKLRELPDSAADYQKTYFNALFSKSITINISDISESQIEKFKEAKNELKKAYNGDKALYSGTDTSVRYLFLTALFAFLTVGSTSSSSFTENMFFDFGAVILFIFGLGINSRQLQKRFKPKGKVFGKIIFGIIAVLMAYSNVKLLAGDCIVPLYVPAIALCSLILVAIFNGKLITMTDYGCEITGKLLGLKNFIKTAELPRLKVLMDENPNYYYDILPYAIAFGLGDKWTKKFSDLKIEKPDWYESSNPTFVFNPARMQTAITSGMNETISAISAASSHSSSGGHSGGGGGGGGGGSW